MTNRKYADMCQYSKVLNFRKFQFIHVSAKGKASRIYKIKRKPTFLLYLKYY